MMSGKRKMLAGALNDATDPVLRQDRLRASALCQRIKAIAATETDARTALPEQRVGRARESVEITPLFHRDHRPNIHPGRHACFD